MSNTNHTFHSTAISAVNEALVTLGQDVVLTELSTSSTTVESRKCAFVYESSRMKVLRDHAWNFARREINCTAYPTEDAADGFRFAVRIPPKCVRLLMCYGDDSRKVSYRVYGTEIKCERPVSKIVYTTDIEDLDKWTPDAYRALVHRLAADLAKPITGRINERQLQESAYTEQIEQAKLSDSRDNNTPDDAWGENHYADDMKGGFRRCRRNIYDCFRR